MAEIVEIINLKLNFSLLFFEHRYPILKHYIYGQRYCHVILPGNQINHFFLICIVH